MKTTSVCAALVAVVGLGMGGCGGGGGSPGDFFAQSVDVTCAKSFECCDAAEIMEQYGFFNITTEAQCKSTLNAFAQIAANELDASIAAGRVVFNADAAAACIDAVSNLTCAEYAATGGGQDMPSGCVDPIEGQVAVGGACANDNECTSGVCVGATNDPPMDGACEALPGPGEMCNFDCAAGHYCEFGSPSMCVAVKANGAACGGDNDECSSNFCDGTPGLCAASMMCNGI